MLNPEQKATALSEISKEILDENGLGDFGSSDAADDGSSGDAGDVAKFGDVVSFEDGSTLTASAPVTFKRDEYAAGGEDFKHHVKFKVTFVNKSGEVFDPALTTGSVTSGEREGDSVYQDGLDAPDNKILPGKKITWWMGPHRR
jgi:hypothetical protein